jgi:hypothetical protein
MAGGPDDIVEQAFDPKKQDAVAQAIEQLSPEEAQYFLDKLERAIRKRKLQLTGYLVAMVLWLIGMVVALYVYGSAPEGKFVGWVFIIPFAAVGVTLMMFGRASERAAGKAPLPPAEVRDKLVAKPPSGAKSAKSAK